MIAVARTSRAGRGHARERERIADLLAPANGFGAEIDRIVLLLAGVFLEIALG